MCVALWKNNTGNAREFNVEARSRNHCCKKPVPMNPLTPELNASTQCCLPRFLLGMLILKTLLRDVFISRSALKG
jgi:hypothetical protein